LRAKARANVESEQKTDAVLLLRRLFFYNFQMNLGSHKGLRVGLGIRGIFGAVVLGLICLFQPLFGVSESLLWAKILLALAAVVYVVFSLIWDRKFISLTMLQFLIAFLLLGATLQTGNIIFVAFGLFSHAMWDLWHLATQKRYVPWWYAGACVYVDLAAVTLIILKA
jgi:hypothetical protein